MADEVKLNIRLTARDRDIILWFNMLAEGGLSVRTWVQAVLAAEYSRQSIDAGSIPVSRMGGSDKEAGRTAGQAMFGDDTSSGASRPMRVQGQRLYAPGDVFMLRATRASIVFILRELRQRNRRVGTYIKAVLRKHIQRDELGPGRLPHDPYIEDMFSFLEAQLGLGTADEKPPKPEARKGGGSHPAEEKSPMGRGGGSRNGQERAAPKPKTEPAPAQAAPNIPKGNDCPERHHVKGVQEQEALAGIQPKEEPEKPKKRRNPLLGHIG